jgi:hypothetical protein
MTVEAEAVNASRAGMKKVRFPMLDIMANVSLSGGEQDDGL